MATTKARVEELEAIVEHLQERVDRLRDDIRELEKQKQVLPYKYGRQVREYINGKVEKEVDEKSHANLIAIINFISALSDMPKGKGKKVK